MELESVGRRPAAAISKLRGHALTLTVSWRALLPFLLGSIPLAFVGGAVQLPGKAYKIIVGLVLLAAGTRLLIDPRERTLKPEGAADQPPFAWAVGIGAAIGFLSGLTGTGGGIFLSPVLLFLGWRAPDNPQGSPLASSS